MKKFLGKLHWCWIKFWGRRYFIYKDKKYCKDILIHGHRIYILDEH